GNVSQIDNLQWEFLPFNRTENNCSYISREEFAEGLDTSLCEWEIGQCLVTCTSLNLTKNITDVGDVMKLLQNDTTTGQNNTWLVVLGTENDTYNAIECQSDEMAAFVSNMAVTIQGELHKVCSETDMRNTRDDGCVKISPPQLFSDDPPIDVHFPVKPFRNASEQLRVGVVTYRYDQHFVLFSDDPPIDVHFPVKPFRNASEQLRVGVVTYRYDQHFVKHSYPVLKSRVVRVEIVGHESKSLAEKKYIDQQINLDFNGTNETYVCENFKMTVFKIDMNTTDKDYIRIPAPQGNYNLSCQFYDQTGQNNITCNVTKCESDGTNALISDMDLIRLKKFRNMCNESVSSDIYIRAEKKYIDQQINLDFNGTNETYVCENFKMTVFKIDMNTTDKDYIRIPAPQLFSDDPPIDVHFPVKPFRNASEQLRVGVVTYRYDQHFVKHSYPVLKSRVIRVETVGHESKNLSDLLFINFPVNSTKIMTGNYNLSCQFYDQTENKWDVMGSFTNLENFNSSNTVNCSYNHMTPFAVILVYTPQNCLQYHKNLPCIAYIVNQTGNYLFYISKDLDFSVSSNTSLCTWRDSHCYVECTSLNFTSNITDVNNIMNLERKDQPVKGQNNITCNVTKCESDGTNALISDMDLIRLKKFRNMCNESVSSDIYIRAEKKYIDQQINLDFNGTNETYVCENFKMTVFKIDMNTTDKDYIRIPAPQLFSDDPPIDVHFPVKPFRNASEQLRVGVVTYRYDQHFVKHSYPVLKSRVIRVETVGHESKNLSDLLFINFPVNSTEIMTGNYNLSCQFYDQTENKWDVMGSFTNLENFNSSNTVNCSYNHMTPFAVILVYTPQNCLQYHKNLPCIAYIVNQTGNYLFYISKDLDFSCESDEMNALISDMDLIRLETFLNMCNESVSSDIYIRAEKKYIDQQINLDFNGTNETYVCENFKMTVFKIDMNTTDKDYIRIPAPQLFSDDPPIDVHFPVKPFRNASEQLRVGVVTYRYDQHFVKHSYPVLKSRVVRVETVGHESKSLSDPLFINFPVPDYGLPLNVFVPLDPFLIDGQANNQSKVAIVTYPSAEQFVDLP
ncbi:adhesion G protein-coupled receptor G3-like, partial [Clarias magur]